MSGGVDSSVAAALLKEQGFDVQGIHIKMWSPSASSGQDNLVCRQQYRDRLDAIKVAAHLDIPFETWDFTDEYRKEVVEYMIREYAEGRTPNPDVMCNRHIKFGVFLRRALEMGADYVATGHYARLRNEFKRLNVEMFKLLQAKDLNKDQSYFLWTLTQKQIKHCLFPIGEYAKPEVRELARKFGLSTAEKADSQGVCFIGEIEMRDFLKRYIPIDRGPVLTSSGKAVGEHEGLAFHTIGQREGLGIGGGIPYYVAAKDFSRNALVVAEGPYDQNLFKNKLTAADIHWVSGTAPKLPLKCKARIRYRQPLQNCIVRELQTTNHKLQTKFIDPQRAVTPGQSIVFYQGEEMLGGGIISVS